MKRIKITVAALAVTCGLVASFAFSAHKSFAPTTYFYKSGTANQRLEPGHVGGLDAKERTIISSLFTATSDWTVNPQSFTSTSDYSKYIGSITFDDASLSLTDALSGVFTQYSAPNPDVMQASYTVNGVTVNITAATAAH